MRADVEVGLGVSADAAWDVLADVRAWPQWTPTVDVIDAEFDRPKVGMSVMIKQPGRRPAHYRVDLVEPHRRFRWGSDRGGIRQLADHVVTSDGPDSCTVRLSFAITGPVGSLLGVLVAGKIRRMVRSEADALHRRLTQRSDAANDRDVR